MASRMMWFRKAAAKLILLLCMRVSLKLASTSLCMQNVCVCELLSCVFTYMKTLFLMRCLPLFVCFQKSVESWDVCYISWFLKILLLYIITTCPFRISFLVMNGGVPASCLYWSNAVFSWKKKKETRHEDWHVYFLFFFLFFLQALRHFASHCWLIPA